jgi:hypothetical protein
MLKGGTSQFVRYYDSIAAVRSSAVLFLSAPMTILRQRVTERSGGSESRDEYYDLFGAGYLAWLKKHIAQVSVLDTDRVDPRDVLRLSVRILAELAKEIP